MGMRLKQRVALITGGGTGIGLAITEAYLREGAQVAIASRNSTHLQVGAAAARAIGHDLMTVQLDITDSAAVREAMESIARHYGRFDILVNNAGLSGRTAMTGPDDSRWLAVLVTNLNGGCCRSKQG